MSAASIKAKAAAKSASGKGTKNTSYTTADGRGVTIKNGVKTYSDKPVNVKGKSGQSISGRDYSINKGGSGYAPVITPESLGKTDVANIPPPPVSSTDFASILNVGNAGLADTQNGLSYDGTKFNINPTDSPSVAAAKEANSANAGALNAIAQFLKPEANQFEDAYSQTLKESGLRKYEKQRDQYANELNAIVATRDANKLKLEGQGRGISDVIIGGQQAKIDREAAIQALPIQAQLAAAQGAVDTAQKHVDTLFQIRAQDIQATNTYKTNLANSVLQFANQSQQNILNAKLSDIAKEEARQQQALADAKQIALQAIEYGQSSLAARVMGLDPKSKTYEQDVRNAMAQLSKPVAGGGAPDIKNFGTADAPIWKQYNSATGSWEDVSGISGGAMNEAAGQKSLDQFNFLKKTISEAKDLVDATGPNMITQGLGNLFVGNTRVKQLQNKIDSLKTNLLTLNTDPNVKKFFGPQMSNKDTELLLSAGSTLNAYDSSEQANAQELIRYQSLINRMEKAVREGLGQEQATFQYNPNALPGSVLSSLQQPNIIYTPDGLQIEIID